MHRTVIMVMIIVIIIIMLVVVMVATCGFRKHSIRLNAMACLRCGSRV